MDRIWEEIHSTREWGQYPAEYVIRFMARNYYSADRGSIKVLDFGCGGGANTWYLSREGFDTYAFDGSESAVLHTGEKLSKEGLKADLRVLDGTKIDYGNDFFDAVVDCVCVYANSMKDIVKMYEEIYRVLKPGGKLISSCFGTQTTGYATGEEIEKDTFINLESGPNEGRGTSHFYKMEDLEKLLKGIGFKNLKTDTMSYTDEGSLVELYIAKAEK